MVTKLLHSQSFSNSKVWKTAVRQKICEIVSKIWSRKYIICRPLRGHILFAYPTNFSASIGNNYIGYLELRLKTCNNVKSVIIWNASFRLASRSFKNTGPNNSTIFNRRIDRSQCFEGHHVLKTATRTSLLQTWSIPESKIQSGFNRTTIPWQYTFSDNDNCKRALNTYGNLVVTYRLYHPKQSLTFLSTQFRFPAPPLRI